MRRVFLTTVALCLVAGTARADPAATRAALLYAQTVLKNEKATCSELNTAWSKIREARQGDPDDPVLIAIRTRLFYKRSNTKDGQRPNCLHPELPDESPPPSPTTVFRKTYAELQRDLERRREQCHSVAECGELKPREEELNHLAVYLIRALPEDSRELRELEAILTHNCTVLPSVDVMIETLRSKALTHEQSVALLDVFTQATNRAELLRNLAQFLDKLQGVDTAAVQALLDAMVGLCGTTRGCTTTAVKQIVAVNAQLADDEGREVLRRTIEFFKNDPILKERASKVKAELERQSPDAAKTIVAFFEAVGPLALLQAQMRAEHATETTPLPADARFIPTQLIRDAQIEKQECRPDVEFSKQYIDVLHFNFGPQSGFRVPVVQEFATPEQEAELVADFDAVSKGVLAAKAVPQCLAAASAPTSPYAEVCSPPLPGTVAFTMRRTEQGIAVDGSCWVDVAQDYKPKRVSLFTEQIMPATCGEEAKLERQKLAIKLALVAPDGECVLFRRQPNTCPPSTPQVTTSSGWYALGFAGAPYLQDSRASVWSKVVPSVLDVALLIGAGISFGLAVDYRNQHAAGQASLRPATRALNLGIGFAIGWGATRVVSGIGYETTSFWQEQRQ